MPVEPSLKKRTLVRPHYREQQDGDKTRVRAHLRTYRTTQGTGVLKKGEFTDFAGSAKIGRFVVQDHKAKRRHLDLRLDTGKGAATSFAARSLPNPGESVKVIAQPDHPISYMDYQGRLWGYGQGTVSKHLDEPIEIHDAKDGKISFSIHGHRNSDDLALVRLGGDVWLFRNFTPPDSEVKKHLSKLRYGEMPIKEVPLDDPDVVLTPKIDGAHAVIVLEGGKHPRVYSYKVGKHGRPIEYTHKIPGLFSKRTPGSKTTVLRGEVYAVDKVGKALPNQTVGAILNAGVWNSRKLLDEHRAEMRIGLFNVSRYKDEPFLTRPYEEKLEVMKEAGKIFGGFHAPLVAHLPKEKRKLLAQVEKGKLKETKEGVVIERLKSHARPVKAKLKDHYDVYVRGVYPGLKGFTKKYAGGLTYSRTARGPVLGRVGTGFSLKQRREMLKYPDRWIGKVIRVESPGSFPSGALRSPVYKDVHWEKSG